ncbi:hypothetical protein Javan220_0024 [Streptococcus phage Javan220]|nr:hypothetical protein Javan220_0024 [Streptococcus phage Javan220]SFR59712.1 hypothetical protein SAMN05216416_0039 [Streptococcus equinus]
MDYTTFSYLDAQQAIGKRVVDGIINIAPEKGAMNVTIPVKFGDDDFEIEVRFKND